MMIIRPDYDRTIDLPGAGPCPRPVDIDRARTGFSDLVSLRVYSFAQGIAIDGEAEGDEVFIVLMRGAAEIAVSKEGAEVGVFPLARDGGLRAVYMPPHASYRLTAVSDCDIAYARVEPVGAERPATHGFAPAGDRLDIVGYATGMDLALATMRAGEPAGSAGQGSPERFIHLRAADEMTAILAGEPLGDWDSVALGEGESITITIDTGAADILTISAASGRDTFSKRATTEGATEQP